MTLLPHWTWLVTGAVGGLVAYCNLPAAFLRPAERATAAWLREAPVKPIDNADIKSFTAEQLWKGKGAVIMAVRRPG